MNHLNLAFFPFHRNKQHTKLTLRKLESDKPIAICCLHIHLTKPAADDDKSDNDPSINIHGKGHVTDCSLTVSV